MSSRIQTLIFDKRKFDRASARAWAQKHDFKASKVDETEDSLRVRQRDPEDGKKYRTIKLTGGVKAVVEILPRALVGKMTYDGGAAGGGATPVLRDTALPDFKTIYFQPKSKEAEEQDREVQETRRQSLALQNSGRFGLYGETSTQPSLRYEAEAYPAIVRGKQDPERKAPKLVIRGTNPRILKPKDEA